MKIILPFKEPNAFPITQKFGNKYIYGGKQCVHYGVDWAMPKGTQLIAPFDCKVIETTPDQKTGYGKSAWLKADDCVQGTVLCLIAHMSELGAITGLHLKQGEKVGLSGNSGFWLGVNGYHLHFGIKLNGKYIDPLSLFPKINQQTTHLLNQNDTDVADWLGTYEVKPGDSLWKISEHFYGSGSKYMEIFYANQQILANPQLIHPGDLLRIPALKNKGV